FRGAARRERAKRSPAAVSASRATLATKRLLDIVIAAIGLVLFAPLLLLTAVMVRIKLGSPVLFTQLRPGLHGRPFRMLKFRSMTDARDASGALLPDAERLTRLVRSGPPPTG